jgi:cobalamin biosynthesis protein CobT
MVRLGAFKHNIDGEAVEFSAKRVSQRPETRKIVFSLCDGEPCGGQGTDAQLGQNIVDVCKRARAAGLEVYGVGINTDRPAHWYGKENFVYLENRRGETIAQQFVRVFAEIITKGQVKI